MLFTPYWWRRASANIQPQTPRERSHRDGMMVTSESPDALEEMIWMAFFPRCHDPSVCNLLSADNHHPDFESFYNRHIRKLLLAEGATRYAAKANYHVARLAYLIRLFPDARFIIPVRSPVGHIASLMRQQVLFSREERKHPRALAYMRRSGHFEFGLDRRPIHLGDDQKTRRVIEAWANREEVRGLAIYWSAVYEYLANLLASNVHVRNAALIVQFETLCANPSETLKKVFAHCSLPDVGSIVDRYAPGIRIPKYYENNFSQVDLAIIQEETDRTVKLWGY